MMLTSAKFLSYSLVSMIVYWLMPAKVQWIALLLISVIFYLIAGGPYTIAVLLLSIASVYIASRLLEVVGHPKRKIICIATVMFNMGILLFFKHMGYWVDAFEINFAKDFFSKLIAPLAISYYTLQLIAYLLDVYWGGEICKNPLKFILYIMYYPQLFIGPISRYSQVGINLFERHLFDYDRVLKGFRRILWGLFKKLVVAERIGLLVEPVYGNFSDYSGLTLWLCQFLFVIQLYMDFSGGMDIVLGISSCYGITLPENFRTPLLSMSAQEFWQRWHITLGLWMKDYVMMPVQRSGLLLKVRGWLKKRGHIKLSKTVPLNLAMLVLWMTVGAWHGSGMRYIIGVSLWFWLVIMAGQIWKPWSDKLHAAFHINPLSFLPRCFAVARTFVIVAIGTVFFRVDSVESGFLYLKRALAFEQRGARLLTRGTGNPSNAVIIVYALLISLWHYCYLSKETDGKEEIENWQTILLRWTLYVVIIWMIIIFGIYGGEYSTAGFMYEHF